MAIPDFKEILDSLPERPLRSRLEPYRELILEMRRRGRPFREIVHVLDEKCGVHVVASTVHDFVKSARTRERDHEPNVVENSRQGATRLEEGPIHDELDDRIAALKARKAQSRTAPKRFQFVSGEPLRLASKRDRKS
jgi:hypothetical protein